MAIFKNDLDTFTTLILPSDHLLGSRAIWPNLEHLPRQGMRKKRLATHDETTLQWLIDGIRAGVCWELVLSKVRHYLGRLAQRLKNYRCMNRRNASQTEQCTLMWQAHGSANHRDLTGAMSELRDAALGAFITVYA
ncbi:hypothetical protein KC335_g175 [Hortaea werneckii]|nr:hypothetical protein KC335_g175 [Hortaea werneckii]